MEKQVVKRNTAVVGCKKTADLERVKDMRGKLGT